MTGSPPEKWPAAQVSMRRVDDLTPYARNARIHEDDQVAKIVQSIEEFGWTVPVLVDETGTLIAGHGRVMAAKSLGLDEIPAMVAVGWTDMQKRAYVIADNRLTELADWDDDLLRVELEDLVADGFDIELTGFALDDLEALQDGASEEFDEDADSIPAPPDDPVSVEGDIWQLGNHRIICGDSTQAHIVERLLGDNRPYLMVTDPPYGVEYDADWRNKAVRSDGSPIAGRAIGKVKNDDKADWREAWALFPGDVAYVWHAGIYAGIYAGIVLESLESSGFEIRSQIIWAKTRFAISRGHYHWQHEPCWYAVKKGATGHWNGGRDQTTLWEIDHQKSETGHSTQKPLEAMRRPILNNSKRGDAIYDPFLGSGTTLIACEKEDRHCFGVELSPAYIDVIVRRWQEFTGQSATLENDGRQFDDIASDRQRIKKDHAA